MLIMIKSHESQSLSHVVKYTAGWTPYHSKPHHPPGHLGCTATLACRVQVALLAAQHT